MSHSTALALAAFSLTVVVEGIVAALLLRRFAWPETISIQLVTWPIASVVLANGGSFWPTEAGVTVAETFLWLAVLPLTFRRAVVLAVAANLATAAIGWSLSS